MYTEAENDGAGFDLADVLTEVAAWFWRRL
jgi:hypothetical protein